MTDQPLQPVSRALRAAAKRGVPNSSRLPETVFTTTDVDEYREVFSVVPGELQTFIFETRSDSADSAGSALIQIKPLDSNGNRRSLEGWGYVSARVGEYQYLEPQREHASALTRITVRVPMATNSIELVGHRWKRRVKTEIIGNPISISSEPGPIEITATGIPIPVSAELFRQQIEIPAGAKSLSARIPVFGGNKSGKVPFAFEQYDVNGQLVFPPDDSPQHSQYGAINLVEIPAEVTSMADLAISISGEASTVAIRGIDWHGTTPTILNEAEIQFQYKVLNDAWTFLNELKSEERLLVVDTTAPPVGHDTLSLRPNNMTLSWARSGIKVIFIPFSTVQDKGANPEPGVLQVNRESFIHIRDWLLTNRKGAKNTYVCSSFANSQSATWIDTFNARGWNTVYECRDDMEEFNRVGYSRWYHPQLERRVVESVDRVSAVSESLGSKLKTLTRQNVPVAITPNGVTKNLISSSLPHRSVERLAARNNSQTFGYVGHLTDAWFDWDIMVEAAKVRPDYRFEVVGHGMPGNVKLPANIVYLGPKTHDELDEIVKNWRAGLIPFINSPLTRSVDPNKIYEYFAWGLPCISAPMGSVSVYPSTQVYSSLTGFLQCLDQQVASDMSTGELAEIETFLRSCSWDARALQTTELFFR